MIKSKSNHDNRDDHGHDNDNGGKAVAPAPTAAGALTCLTALGAKLNAVNTASVGGRSGLPLMRVGRQLEVHRRRRRRR